jgi:hypothetical protein
MNLVVLGLAACAVAPVLSAPVLHTEMYGNLPVELAAGPF